MQGFKSMTIAIILFGIFEFTMRSFNIPILHMILAVQALILIEIWVIQGKLKTSTTPNSTKNPQQ
jgi:hypothetical protein